ncbi:caspase-3-like [Physella acuta]|uniref:caspase-3-like n=1 Tax=Physella acuta TaxID=109671 RepID=UPI0027DD5A90|nr:caspase-3-like [Physella acuta]
MDDSESDGFLEYKGTQFIKQEKPSYQANPPYRSHQTINSTDFYSDDEYNFSNPRRGVAVIIVNDTFNGKNKREGCTIDLANLQTIFSSHGFEIRSYYDKTVGELMKELKNISSEDHSSCDCLVLAISTHGDEVFSQDNSRQDVIYTKDAVISTKAILELFNDQNCPSLKNKPRLAFIQACRGGKLDDGMEITCTKQKPEASSEDVLDEKSLIRFKSMDCSDSVAEESLSDALFSKTRKHVITDVKHVSRLSEVCTTPAPCFKDFLVMYSCPPGFFAFRRPREGSWFIKCLADVLLTSRGGRSLMQELTTVVGLVARERQSESLDPVLNAKKQSPVIYSMLTKEIYLRKKV